MTFYRLSTAAMVTRWRSATTGDFRFAVKLWRRITHEKRLVDCAAPLAAFLDVAAELGPRAGPLLVQLPPSLRKDTRLLDRFLSELRQAGQAWAWRVAVEFRDPDWLTEPVYEVLDRHGAALCLADMPKCPITEPNNADFVYVRRHGPGGGYRGRYTTEHVRQDAERIRQWLGQNRDVYCYYNNDIDGHAVDNARQLKEMVAEPPS